MNGLENYAMEMTAVLAVKFLLKFIFAGRKLLSPESPLLWPEIPFLDLSVFK